MEGRTTYGENTTCDFKESVERRQPKSWLKSVSAFANSMGGVLVFGVNDNGETVGLDNGNGSVNGSVNVAKNVAKNVADVVKDVAKK